MDLTGSVVLLCIVLVLPTAISLLAQGLFTAFKSGFTSLGADLSTAALARRVVEVIEPVLPGLGLLIGCALVMGLTCNFSQVGFVLSGEALNPKWDRLNPAQGLKRILGLSGVMEGLKALLKSVLFGAIAYSVVRQNFEQLMVLAWLPPLTAMTVIGGVMRTMAIRVGLMWLALAALDYFYQRKRLDKQLRMTKEEVKQEMKEMEQSPELKRAIIIRRRRLSRRMMAAVKNASVVVTNPTHYSVAIQYEAGKAHAPQIVAKGVDHLAFKIREIAAENQVPIVPNPPLARALYKHCEVGDFIPREYFQPVAEVLAYVYRTVKRLRKK
jgi:flagellar biosynthetic protein FlhB